MGSPKRIKRVKFYLIFFCALQLIGCKHENKDAAVKIIYTNDKAVGIGMLFDTPQKNLQVFVAGESKTPVLGSWVTKADSLQFTPVVAFSRGQSYEIKKANRLFTTFSISGTENLNPPEILAIYPSADTVPENVLKLYIQFSRPMQEVGNFLDFITVYNETTQKEESIFLALETELWNKEHDRLTLWLDPGRIKTDLIPNQKQGLPLRNANTYTIRIAADLKSGDGNALAQEYAKKWTVSLRDDVKPKISSWNMGIPENATKQALTIDFYEAMDAILLKETVHIMNSDTTAVKGRFELQKEEHVLAFYPEDSWQSGIYTLIVESRLEDLAGNNLNRLFDTDLGQDADQTVKTNAKSRVFTIE